MRERLWPRIRRILPFSLRNIRSSSAFGSARQREHPHSQHEVGSRAVCSACGGVHYRNPAVGVAVVVLDEGRALLGRRARGSYRGRWCVPCGYVEWDEDIRDAARREMAEETGLTVEIGEVCAVHSNFHDRARQTVGVWFYGTVAGGALRAGDDLDQVAYFALDALPELAFPTDGVVLKAVGAQRAAPLPTVHAPKLAG